MISCDRCGEQDAEPQILLHLNKQCPPTEEWLQWAADQLAEMSYDDQL